MRIFFLLLERVLFNFPSSSQIEYNDTFGTQQSFSPIFNREFLLGMLELQQGLESIVTEKNGVTLADICNSPMSPQVLH